MRPNGADHKQFYLHQPKSLVTIAYWVRVKLPGAPHRPAAATAHVCTQVMKVPYDKSGKCGDIVHQRARWGMISYAFFVPKNPRTERQRYVRKNFTLVSMSWALLEEPQRVAWRLRGKSKKTRRRLGESWPLPGFNYYMRENVWLANRGQPQLALPPVEPCLPKPDLPLLSRTLSPQQLELLIDSAPAPAKSPGRAPPPTG
jgi:hypothetical protein